ncbi:MAG: hypothetical protein JO227_08385, partial [Acetobacteraceae bacterium]|nr:hypothetical protein [Acetobacteraceae bacterium]
RSVRFGFVSLKEIQELRAVSRALGDDSFEQPKRSDGLPAAWRAPLYAIRFPPLYFDSLAKGGVFLRWWRNQSSLQRVLASRGQYFFGTDAGSSVVAAEGHLKDFRPLPVLDHYFDRILALLEHHGIVADFVAMPINEATASSVDPGVRTGFADYLAAYQARHPGFHVVGDVMPHWPDRYFGDGFSHLNPDGAKRWSAQLGAVLRTQERTASDLPQTREGVLCRLAAAGGAAEDAEACAMGVVQ